MRGSTAGLADGILHPKRSYHAILLELIDILFSALILGPAVVAYWRGTWNLMGHYLYPASPTNSAIGSLLIGVSGHLIFTGFQSFFTNAFNPDRRRLTFYVVSRAYSIIYAICCVNGWRGLWLLLDIHSPPGIPLVLLSMGVSAILLALLKTLRNISAVPFVCVVDDAKGYFEVPTMYKTSGSRDPGLYVLDCLFSVLVIGSLVVFVWRGLWVLCDLKLFPQSPAMTAWASAVIGYSVVGVTFALQPLMKWACDRLEGFWRVAVADMFIALSFVGTVNVWRGVWHLLDLYFIPENRLLSDWITHVISMILLILLNCFNSVLVRGVYIDAEEPAGKCVIFPIYYIRLFFQKERKKKQRRLLETLEKQGETNISLIEKSPLKNTFNDSFAPQESEKLLTRITANGATTAVGEHSNASDDCKIMCQNDE